MRRRTSAAALSLTLLAVIGAPAAAQADPFILSITSVAPQTDHPEVLQVGVTSSAEVQSVTAEISPLGSDATVLKTSLTKVGDLWQTDAMVLPTIGYYKAKVTVVDADDETVSGEAASYPYLMQPVIGDDHVIDTTPLDPTHRFIVATGHVSLRDPRNGNETPAGNAQLRMHVTRDGSQDDYYFWTNSAGSYKFESPAGQWGQDPTFEVSADVVWDVNTSTTAPLRDTTFGKAEIDSATFTAHRRAARLVMAATKVTVKYPTKAVIAGTLQQEITPGVWQALPGYTVQQDNNSGVTQQVKTDADGKFSFSVAASQDGKYAVTLPDYWEQSTFLTNAPSGSTTVNVIDRTTITWNSPSIDQYADLSLNGWLSTSSGTSAPAKSKIWVEQSANGKTGWKTLGYTLTQSGGSFYDSGYLTNPSGYFRLVYDGSSTLQPSVSRVVHLKKIDTRIAGINASPEPIRSGGTLTVKGTVQYLKSGHFVHAGKNHYVQVFFRAKGSKTYTYKGQVKTTSAGTFSFRAKATKDGSWTAAWFPSSSSYVNAYGYEDYVDVR